MTISPDRLRLLHGTDTPFPDVQVLHAGPVRALLDGIDLRYIGIGRTELVRRIYVAVRDRNWNTIPGEVSGLEVDARENSFDVRFSVRHQAEGIAFVLGHALGVPGLPVDRHVLRVANRIGIARSEEPEIVEQKLGAAVPPDRWIFPVDAPHSWLVLLTE